MDSKVHYLIQKNLKSSKKATDRDIELFNKYYNGELTLDGVRYLWKLNNEVSYTDYEKINLKQFQEWLNSLGWSK